MLNCCDTVFHFLKLAISLFAKFKLLPTLLSPQNLCFDLKCSDEKKNTLALLYIIKLFSDINVLYKFTVLILVDLKNLVILLLSQK